MGIHKRASYSSNSCMTKNLLVRVKEYECGWIEQPLGLYIFDCKHFFSPSVLSNLYSFTLIQPSCCQWGVDVYNWGLLSGYSLNKQCSGRFHPIPGNFFQIGTNYCAKISTALGRHNSFIARSSVHLIKRWFWPFVPVWDLKLRWWKIHESDPACINPLMTSSYMLVLT